MLFYVVVNKVLLTKKNGRAGQRRFKKKTGGQLVRYKTGDTVVEA
jgi:hypothetical protein